MDAQYFRLAGERYEQASDFARQAVDAGQITVDRVLAEIHTDRSSTPRKHRLYAWVRGELQEVASSEQFEKLLDRVFDATVLSEPALREVYSLESFRDAVSEMRGAFATLPEQFGAREAGFGSEVNRIHAQLVQATGAAIEFLQAIAP